MSFARLLSGDAGIGSRDEGGSNVNEKDSDSKESALHHAAGRMLKAIDEKDHEGLSSALADWHELRGASGSQASARTDEAEPFHD